MSTTTFWKLINDHRIEVPTIQRDYAQGRKNPKSKEIRKNFIEQLKRALEINDNNLHLNFVYGKVLGRKNATKIAENKEAVKSMLTAVETYSRNLELDINWDFKENGDTQDESEITTFAPLDGQQRLTTLFLLHWYLMPDTEENKRTLKKFSYKIRPSSKDFCEDLVENKMNVTKLGDKKIAKHIENTSWFFDYWKYDPSVRGMLRMLNQIQTTFGNENLNMYWERLVQKQAVIFEFLDLDDFKLTDELYVRMNARGVSLTPFENFKAWLIEYIENNKLQLQTFIEKDNIEKSWVEQLDASWTNLFWANKDEDNMLIDEELMRYFRNMMQVFLVLQPGFTPDENKEVSKEGAEKIRKRATLLATETDSETGEYKYIPNSFFDENKLLSAEILNELFLSIDNFSKESFDLDRIARILYPGKESENISLFRKGSSSIFKRFINKESTYPDKVMFYALHVFLRNANCKEGLNQNALRSWMRVTRNLIENSTIDSISIFKRAITSIENFPFTDIKDNMYAIFGKNDLKLEGFNVYQVEEEKRKAQIILVNTAWENVFLKYENHEYFRGQINFLLDLAEMEEEPLSIEVFEKNASKMAAIFDAKIKDPNNTLFERALLTEKVENSDTGYLFRVNSNHSFGTMTGSKSSWKSKVFRNKERLSAIKQLLNKVDVNNVAEDLEEVCRSYNEPGWRYQLINTPKAITFCQQRMIRFWGEHNIRLLGSSATSHYHAELYSFCLNQKIQKQIAGNMLDISPIKRIDYALVRSASYPAHARYEVEIKKINFQIHLHYDFRNLKVGETFMEHPYEIKFFAKDEEKNELELYEESLHEVLTGCGFDWKTEEKVKGFWASAETDDKIINILEQLAKRIQQL